MENFTGEVQMNLIKIVTNVAGATIIGLDVNGVEARFPLDLLVRNNIGQYKTTDAAPPIPLLNQNYKLVGNAIGNTPSGTYSNMLMAPGTPLVIPSAIAGHAIIEAYAVWNGTFWDPIWQDVPLPTADPTLPPRITTVENNISQAFVISGNSYYTGADVYTIAPPAVPNTTSAYAYGWSFPGGKLVNPTNKPSFKLAKTAGTAITTFEVRILQTNASGALITSKRTAVTIDNAATSFDLDITLDAAVTNVNTELWVELMADGLFAVKYLSPAVKFTTANGYTAPRYTAVNNLDGTAFATVLAQNVDVYVKFNSLFPKLVPQPQLTGAITDGVKTVINRMADESVITLPLLPVASYLNLNNGFTPSTNWRAVDWTPAAPGDQLVYSGKTPGGVSNGLVVANADKSSVLVLVGTSADLTPLTFLMPDGYTQFAMCATVASGATYSFQVKKYILKSGTLPTSGIPNDYDNLKKTIPYGWNAVGHSIWWQDGVIFNATDGLPDSGNMAKGIQTWVRSKITFTSYNNYGYSGRSLAWSSPTDTQSILKEKDTWVANRIWSIDFITNDFRLERPIGTQADFLNRTGATTVYGALGVLADKMYALDPFYICICATPLQRNNGGYTSYSINGIGKTMQDYIDALLWVRNRLAWRLVDQWNNSGFTMDNVLIIPADPNKNLALTRDGLHPTNAGYARYYGLWLSEFYKLSY